VYIFETNNQNNLFKYLYFKI